MINTTGRFVWHELMTSDVAGAKAFYGDVVGWGAKAGPASGYDYAMLTIGDAPVAGLMPIPPEARAMGVPPNWGGYVAVDDVDATVAQAAGLGGKTPVPPRDIPDICRFAVIADPHGAALTVVRWTNAGPQDMPDQMAPGRVGWNELMSADWETAFAYYAALFGWTKADAVPMGEMGVYQLFARDGVTLGGMFNKPPSMPVSAWLYYFNVSDIDAGMARVTAGGGKILNGPMQVPGDAWIAQCMDPQGAMFSLVGMRPAA
jgi:predicted enzyme related to lactoylglutathione lyase